jgi:hypothetical protein
MVSITLPRHGLPLARRGFATNGPWFRQPCDIVIPGDSWKTVVTVRFPVAFANQPTPESLNHRGRPVH